jgi:hypothetical protein
MFTCGAHHEVVLGLECGRAGRGLANDDPFPCRTIVDVRESTEDDGEQTHATATNRHHYLLLSNQQEDALPPSRSFVKPILPGVHTARNPPITSAAHHHLPCLALPRPPLPTHPRLVTASTSTSSFLPPSRTLPRTATLDHVLACSAFCQQQ